MVPIYAHQVSRSAVNPNALVAFACVVGRVLVIDVLNSAAEDNIEDQDDVDDFGHNLFTQLVRLAVVAHEGHLKNLMFSRWDRMLRNSRHGAYLKETIARRAHLLTLWVDGNRRDVSSLGAEVEQVVAIANKLADAEKQFSGAYTKCQNHEWTRPEFHLPSGARLGVGRDKNTVHWLPDEIAVVAELYAACARGVPMARIADLAVEKGLLMRHPQHRRPDGSMKTLAEVYPGTNPETAERDMARREAVVATLFREPARRAYRTGRYPFRMVAPAPGKAMIDGAKVQFASGPEPVWHERERGRSPLDLRHYGYMDFQLDWGLPSIPDDRATPIEDQPIRSRVCI